MIGRAIGQNVAVARDGLARGLIRLRVTPNMLSALGAVFTAGAAFCLVFGTAGAFQWRIDARSWLLLAAGGLFLAAACDTLDGAVARIGNSASRFGALLDSTLDRFSDFAIYAGITIGYALTSPPNITFMLLALIAFFNAFMISYTRARAENLIRSCSVGFWQRGERTVAIIVALVAHNIPALLVQQALLPLGTVLRRIAHAHNALSGRAAPRAGLIAKLCPWRAGRGTLAYDFAAAVNMAWLLFARFEASDVLRRLGN